MTDSFQIVVHPGDNGFTFTYNQDQLVHPINCAGSQEALRVKNKGDAEDLQRSIESNAIWFDEEDHLIIASPLYFIHSIEQTGSEWLLEQVENWPIFWSMDPFFHYYNSSLREAAPVQAFLHSIGISSENLPDGDYENWEDLNEEHFLPEESVKKLTAFLLEARDKKKQAGLYFAFNSPHIVAGIAWVNNYFESDEDFVNYTLLAEKFNGKEKEKEAEIRYRLEQLAEIRKFIN